jgi:hypothetical protein
MPTDTLPQRFWSKVLFGLPSECWVWQGGTDSYGHGQIQLGRRGEGTTTAQRVAFFLTHGYWPEYALHIPVDCHNQLCCNPLHIYDGTPTDNALDKTADGTHSGAKYRFTVEEEQAIYERYIAGGITQAELGREYGVSHITAHTIVKRVRENVRM